MCIELIVDSKKYLYNLNFVVRAFYNIIYSHSLHSRNSIFEHILSSEIITRLGQLIDTFHGQQIR
ncbi:unnamed protein product [Acanthoscelides obtectus]|uniref:Uncharacterized protein n=1 Tax=Acanthoscelides obtectus TaxID=200917 RepID=A0A9P0PV59_ACAOB|nr:unnamed protein product [Acanthoscelides obtectus]CAK1633675.1 hypothetical protein AOBTE_LOCUS8312 [Acanthoscelides obtectus]